MVKSTVIAATSSTLRIDTVAERAAEWASALSGGSRRLDRLPDALAGRRHVELADAERKAAAL